MVARDDTHWNRLLEDTKEHVTYTYLYEREGEVEGYLIYRGGSAEETWLPEFLTLTPRAQRGLLGLLRRHEMQVRKFAWKAPEDDGLWSQCYHKEMETTLGTNLQGRVVDLVGALSAWKPDPSARGTLLLGIHDPTAPWNQGTWKVTFDEGSRVGFRHTGRGADPDGYSGIHAGVFRRLNRARHCANRNGCKCMQSQAIRPSANSWQVRRCGRTAISEARSSAFGQTAMPPSTVRPLPVRKDDSSEAR